MSITNCNALTRNLVKEALETGKVIDFDNLLAILWICRF